MPNPIAVEVKTSRSHKITLTRKDFFHLFEQIGITLPNNTQITFTVPSGGDYSGEVLDICDNHPIKVNWTEEE